MEKKAIKLNLISTTLVLFLVLIVSIITYSKYLENKYPWHIYQNEAYKLLDDYSGEGITIAFLDTGINKELAQSFGDRIVFPFNVITENTDVSDTNGHGTKVICVSSCSFDLNGVYGLAYQSKIMPVVVVDETGRTSGEYISDGIIYAVDNGADIINISLGSRLEDETVKAAVEYAYLNNVIVVSSVGDYGDEKVLYPAQYNNVIAVQSQSKLGVKYKDASWGTDVDILIPGEFIQTLGTSFENNHLEIVYESGSSISTAYLSSVLAIMIQENNEYEIDSLLVYIRDYEVSGSFINLNKFVRGYQ